MAHKKKLQNIGELRKAMYELGMCAPQHLKIDNEIHRFNIDSRDKKQSGWYLIDSMDNRACIGDWRSGTTKTFYFDDDVLGGGRAPSNQGMDSKSNPNDIWQRLAASPTNHPYLKKKKIGAGRARIDDDGLLVVPVEDIDGSLQSLQYIDSEGKKRFIKGQPVKGYGHWAQGCLKDANNNRHIYIVEGYATGITVTDYTSYSVFCSLSSNNIEHIVSKLFKALNKYVVITIIADNDRHGHGEKCARVAEFKYGAKVLVIPSEGDANDFVNNGGDLKALLDDGGEKNQWLVHANQFVHTTEPIQWLIEHWLPQHSLVMLHGSSGIGKSFLALDWSLRISTSIDHYCNNEAVSDGVVVYLAGEGVSGMQARIAAWLSHYKQVDPRLWISKGALLIDEERDCQRIIAEITAICRSAEIESPALIVIDTLHRFFGGDENSAQDVAKFIANCSRLSSAFDCTILIVHHTGNVRTTQNRCRGSSAWRGAMDVELHLSDPDGHDCMQLMQCKTKDFIKQPSIKTKLVTIEIPTDEGLPKIVSAVPKFKQMPK